jgi:hypothetical protein
MPGAAATTDGTALTQWVPGESGRDRVRVPAVEGHLGRRVAGDLDLEPLALGAERPCRFEVLLAHEPVGGHGDHRFAPHRRDPAELLRGDVTWGDGADGGVDRGGGHRHLVGGHHVGVDGEPECLGNHGDGLPEPVTQNGRHHR